MEEFKKIYNRHVLDKKEPLLNDTNNKNVTFPIIYLDIWEHYKRQQASIWSAEEIDFKLDREHFQKRLNKNEQHFIKLVIAFFAASDGIIMENISSSFLRDVKCTELIYVYGYQNYIEQVHGETYSLIIDVLIDNQHEKDRLFNAIKLIPSIREKAIWATKYMDDDLCYSCRIFANACVEGIFFSGSFCAIFWLKERGILPGLIFSNELISKDEADHVKTPQIIWRYIVTKPSIDYVHKLVSEAVEIESKFIEDAIQVELIGMNSKLMIQYIMYVSDRLLTQFEYPKLFHVENPFPFMERIGLRTKANFFEKRVSDYSKLTNSINDNKNEIRFDAEF
jgi:ribonucleotide reductase beta subunit family protein with ferritin-like domain